MIEIIPNWHPIFVHFTVGLFTVSVVFYFIAYLANYINIAPRTFVSELEVAARWCLWVSAVTTILTVLAGLYAYNTVNHDPVSHAAMTNHRNWALPTASVIILVAIWSGWRYSKRKPLTFAFIVSLLFAQALLTSTAWRGGELVFRHGLGVMSLPKVVGEGHQHQHEETVNKDILKK